MHNITVGSIVVKARRYSESEYCKYGGDAGEVPLGEEGIVRSVSGSNISVSFNCGTIWGVDASELDLKKRAKAPKIVHMKPIRMSKKVFRVLNDAIDDVPEGQEEPLVFMLGSDARGVIRTVYELDGGSGCWNMPYVPGTDMSAGMYYMYGHNRVPCGLARVGPSDMVSGDDDTDRGISTEELHRMSAKSIIFTFDNSGTYVEGFDSVGRVVDISYKLVN